MLAFGSGFGHRRRAGWLRCNAQCRRARRTDSRDGRATWRAVAAGPGGALRASALRNAADEAEVVAAGGVGSH